jgi:hypothetical protein
MMTRLSIAALVAVLFGASLTATTYAPVTFGELVTTADVIFVGEVVDVRPFAVQTRDGAMIKTRVVFSVSESLYGQSGSMEVMEFFGGELNGIGMAIADMPTFTVGHRHVVFAHKGPGINPIVGFTQGLLRLKRDASGAERVLTSEGLALDRPESIGGLAVRPRLTVPAMTLPQLRDRIRGALAEARRR